MSRLSYSIRTGIKVGVSLGLIGILLARIGPERILEAFRRTDLRWIGLAVLLYVLSYFLGAFQWGLLLRSEGLNLPFSRLLGVYLVGLFFNHFLPGQMGGDVFRVLDIRKAAVTSAAVSTVLLDRLFGFLVLLGMAVFSVLLVHGVTGPLRIAIWVLILLWMVGTAFLFSRRLARPLAGLFHRILPRRIALSGQAIYERIYRTGRKKGLLLTLLGLSMVIQGQRILTHFYVARSLGLSVSVWPFFLFIPLIAVATLIPVGIGGIGIREQTAVLLFSTIGMAAEDAVVMECVAYVISIFTSLPGGGLFILRRRQERRFP